MEPRWANRSSSSRQEALVSPGIPSQLAASPCLPTLVYLADCGFEYTVQSIPFNPSNSRTLLKLELKLH
ncbi:hypothetical protein WAI453_002642 [Rhynchosporium graminicola]